jgi:glycerol uptake facilitator-like aquaporin
MAILSYFVEFLGTFFFLSVVIATGNAFLIALSLLAALLMGQSNSGGHFNPAISIMNWMNGTLAATDLPFYIMAQVLGGLVALGTYKLFLAPVQPNFFKNV